MAETPVYLPEHNKVYVQTKITISENETISGTKKVYTFGAFDQGQRWGLKYTKPLLIKEGLKKEVNLISPGGELVDYKISDVEDLNQPIEMMIEFKGPKFLIDAGKDKLLPKFGGISAGFVSKDERTYPMVFQNTSYHGSEIIVALPENLRVKYLPEPIEYETPYLSYQNKYSRQGNEIHFTENKVFKKTFIPETEYKEFKNFYEKLAWETDRQAVLEKNLHEE